MEFDLICWSLILFVELCLCYVEFSHICVTIAICELFCVLSVQEIKKTEQNGAIWSLCRVMEHGKGLCRDGAHGTACTWCSPVRPSNLGMTIWSVCRVQLSVAHGKGAMHRSWATALCRVLSGRTHGKGWKVAVQVQAKRTANI